MKSTRNFEGSQPRNNGIVFPPSRNGDGRITPEEVKAIGDRLFGHQDRDPDEELPSDDEIERLNAEYYERINAEYRASTALVVRADEVEEADVEWLWPDRIPYGFLTIFAGRTGVGKSFVALDITARVTKGLAWPDATEPAPARAPGRVLIFSEDPHKTILRPRLRTLGADLTMVHFVTWHAMGEYQLGNTDMLDEIVAAAGEPDLILIDPPTNFLGGIDEHSNSQVRGVLMRIVEWIDKRTRPIAVILITQVNKGAKDVEAINRIIGSIAWAATSRIAHTFAPDPEDRSGGLFTCPKSNLGPCPRSLAYRISPSGKQAIVEWLGESELDADHAMSGLPQESASDKAVAWITTKFREKREWPSDELFDLARRDKISTWQITKGKKVAALPIRATQRFDPERGASYWVKIALEGWPK